MPKSLKSLIVAMMRERRVVRLVRWVTSLSSQTETADLTILDHAVLARVVVDVTKQEKTETKPAGYALVACRGRLSNYFFEMRG
jgi:hypothetical protein